MSTGWRWTGAVAATAVLIAIVLVLSAVAVLQALPLDQTTLVIDGERVDLAAVSGWKATLALTAALLAVLLVGLIAIVATFAATAVGLAIAAILVTSIMLLIASPVLLLGWAVWLLCRPASKPGPAGGVAPA